jgi:serine/threonine-protein kinase RsbW
LFLQAQSFFIRKIQASIKNLRNTVSDVLAYYEAVFGDMSEATHTELKVILNELLINAIKHGSKEDEGKCINVIADLTADKYALLVVEDEGEGYDTSFIERDDFGNYGSFGSFISAGESGGGAAGSTASSSGASGSPAGWQAGARPAGQPQTATQPTDPQPVGSQPVGSKPIGPQSANSEAIGPQLVGSQPIGPQPADSQSANSQSVGSKPVGPQPIGPQSAGSPSDMGASAGEPEEPLDALFGIEETGRGIQIVRNLCDDFMVNSKGNKVVVKKRLRRY